MNQEFLAVEPWSGLCNRLRAIFSFYKLSNKLNKPFLVVWDCHRENTCMGNILDYYDKIPNVDYIILKNKDETSNHTYKGIQLYARHNKQNKPYNICSSGGEYADGRNPEYCGKYSNLYKELKLNSYMQDIINNNKLKIKKYISVHIRRTDHKHHEPDENYINFLKKYPEYNIYIACDNSNIQNKFYELFNDRILTQKHKAGRDTGSRFTDLKDAIIDLHMCIESDIFYGTHHSSFSELIYSKRYFNNKMNDYELKIAKKKGAVKI
tara:strand:+ start:931 stop:1728 length:798 start_codon:yes stop_codon:yes gene_type:complete